MEYDYEQFISTHVLSTYAATLGQSTTTMIAQLKQDGLFQEWNEDRIQYQYDLMIDDDEAMDIIEDMMEEQHTNRQICTASKYYYKSVAKYLDDEGYIMDLRKTVSLDRQANLDDELSKIFNKEYIDKRVKMDLLSIEKTKLSNDYFKPIAEEVTTLMLDNGASKYEYDGVGIATIRRPVATSITKAQIVKALGEDAAKVSFPQLFETKLKVTLTYGKFRKKYKEHYNK